MRRIIAAAALTLGLVSSGAVIAAEQRATLRIDNMYCASCPFIVKQTLAGLPGVRLVEVSYDNAAAVAVAVVVYEDNETDIAALTTATSDIGFPSTVTQ